MQVEGHLPAPLHLLLLLVALLQAAQQQTLAQKLLGSAARLDVQQGVVCILGQALAEGTDAQLHHGAVVQDLGEKGNALRGDGHRQSSHTQQTSRTMLWTRTDSKTDQVLPFHGVYALEIGVWRTK